MKLFWCPKTRASRSVWLLEEAGVATVAGTSFGDYGEGYLRLSYANSLENIGEAMERIRHFLDEHRKGGG